MKYTIAGKKLDKYQKKIIRCKNKNLFVLAGAGSGKTFTIVAKVKSLLSDGLNSSEILCISFTKKSANSLRSKLESEGLNVEVRTFHSLGFNIVKKFRDVSINEEILDFIIDESIRSNKYLKEIVGVKFVRFGGEDKIFNILEQNILLNSDHISRLKIIMKSFINLYKGNNYGIDMFRSFNQYNHENHIYDQRVRHNYFLNLMKYTIIKYNKQLHRSKKIDYNDMINLACNIVCKDCNFKYKYIIIDEYQDTSFSKSRLIYELYKKTGCKVMVVGDDWQCIYSFAGSNLDIFNDFKSKYKNVKVVKLKNTYRLSFELLRVTSGFICKNSYQIRKNLKSSYSISNPIIIYYYKRDINEVLNKVIKEVGDDFLILGRNNSDCDYLNKYKSRFLTIHKSKGLETDNTIIIGLDNIPSKVVESDYLCYVKSKTDSYPFAEERRLFYVALTRCRYRNYILLKKNSSSFVNELIRSYSKYIDERI